MRKKTTKKAAVKEVAKEVQTAAVQAEAEEKTVEAAKPEEKVSEVAEIVEEKVTEVAEKVEEKVAEVAAKTEEVKEAVKKTVKKAAKKAADKKEPVVPEVYIQYHGQEDVLNDVVERAKEAFVADGHRASTIKSLQVYLKPEESAAYYVVNQKYAGKVNLF